MLSNYLLAAWRNIVRNKTFSFIKITGLSIGLAACMLIVLYVKDEVSYDRFHQNGARIYRIDQSMKMGDEPASTMGITNPIVGEAFKKEIPEVESFVRVNDGMATVKKGSDVFTEYPLFVDSNFFSVFSFPLLQGSNQTVLNGMNSVVLSEDIAKKYFGTTTAVGKALQMKINDAEEYFTVSGIAKNAPQNSTVKFGILLPFAYYKQHLARRVDSWAGGGNTTFLLLYPTANTATVQRKMQAVFNENAKAEIAEGEKQMGVKIQIALFLQPLTSIHLDNRNGISNGLTDGSSTTYSYLLSCIAVFILIVACINFINLAIAQSLKRSKEVGIRKVVGGSRWQLTKQFMVESVVVSSVAFALAIGLTLLLLPYFNTLANKKLSLSYLSDVYLFAAYFLLLVLTSFMSGFYPSIMLARFQPVKVLYQKARLTGKNYFTRGLVVLQFALAVFLVIGTIAVYSQLDFLQHKDLGYDSKNLLVLGLPRSKESDDLAKLFKNELARQNAVTGVAAKNGGNSFMPVKTSAAQIDIDYNRVDESFFQTFKIPIVAGRNFSPNFPTDSTEAAVVNESFVKEAGWTPDKAIGQTVRYIEGPKRLTIIGVIKDYHFASLKQKLTAQMFTMDKDMNYGQLWVRIKPANVSQTVSMLEQTYKKLAPLYPFDYQFMETINANNYEEEAKWKRIISIAAGLFIFISCIGLFGLVLLSIEQRTKEIGIRKVLGAAVSRIVLLITKDFIGLVGSAVLIAVPLGYYAVNKWLQNFPYRIATGWWMFAAAGGLIILLALITLSTQTIKAAVANPAKSLRTE